MADGLTLRKRAEAIADRAFAQTQAEEDRKSSASELAVERRLGGRGSHLTPAEKREIAIAYLTDPELGTVSACARYFKHQRETIAGCLKGEDFEQLRRQIDLEEGEDAKRTLKAARRRASQAWVDSLDVAAAQGNHKPSKDLLVATRVIEPAPAAGVMYVGTVVNNVAIWHDGNGNAFTELPADVGLAVQFGAFDSDVQVQAHTLSAAPIVPPSNPVE